MEAQENRGPTRPLTFTRRSRSGWAADDLRWGWVGVEVGDQGGAAVEDGALVDVSLVGDLAGVQGRGLVEQQQALNPA
jgi:hypothetical protein